jgi:hypothetical protein
MINISTLQKTVVFAAPPSRDELCSAPPVRLEVAHHIPGRLRLKADALKHDKRAVVKARQELKGITGVQAIAANLYAGSLTVEYDPKFVDFGTIAEKLSRRGYAVIPGATDSIVSIDSRNVADAVGRALMDALTDRIAVTLVCALI